MEGAMHGQGRRYVDGHRPGWRPPRLPHLGRLIGVLTLLLALLVSQTASSLADLVAFSQGSDYQTAVLADSPYAYYRLADTGTSASDTSGNGLTGTFVNGVTTGQSGAFPDASNAAVSLDGSNDYVALPSGFSDFSSGLTVEAWVYPTSVVSSATLLYLSDRIGAEI
jgi:hypothetical protein